MKKAVIIGGNSDIARETVRLLGDDWQVFSLTRDQYDLSQAETQWKMVWLLSNEEPDLVVHCAGIFGGNELKFNPLFAVNVESAWWPIRYYLDNPPDADKTVRYVMIGSSCYEHGRKNYILYAASKAALHSMWQGASEAVADTIKIGIIHPVRVNTKMVEHITHHSPHLCLEAEDVAREIVKMADMTDHTHLDMGYKKEMK